MGRWKWAEPVSCSRGTLHLMGESHIKVFWGEAIKMFFFFFFFPGHLELEEMKSSLRVKRLGQGSQREDDSCQHWREVKALEEKKSSAGK